MLTRYAFPLLALPLLCASTALAAPVHTLPIVISATRTPLEPSKVGSSVTVLTPEQIAKTGKTSVADVLRTVPGVSVARSGGSGQTSTLFLRGTNSNHALVLIDGVEVNDPSGVANTFDFAHLSVDDIERIEVLRGAQSTLYGSDTIGGVIAITTKRGGEGVSALASAEAGRYGAHGVQASAEASGGDGASVRIGASRRQEDGLSAFSARRGGREADAYKNTTLTGRAETALGAHAVASLALRYTDAETEFDDFGGDANNLATSGQLSGRAGLDIESWGGRWRQAIGISHMHIDRESVTGFGKSDFRGRRSKLDWLNHVQVMRGNTFSFGLESEEDRGRTTFDPERAVRTNAVMVQDQAQMGDLALTLGARVDDHETFGTQTTARAAAAYALRGTGVTLRVSAGSGFSAPSLFQLYSMFGNPALSPEESFGWDMGFEYRAGGGRYLWGVNVFSNRIRELIDFDFATSRYLNVGKAETQGVELFGQASLWDSLDIYGNYTWLLTEDKYTGLALLRRPRHAATLGADWQPCERLGLGVEARYNGGRDDLDLAFVRTRLGGYFLLDMRARYRLPHNVELFGRIENLLDKEYEELYAFGTAGRAVYVGVKARF